MKYKLDTKILFGFCIILSIIAIQAADFLTLIFGNLVAFSIWYIRRNSLQMKFKVLEGISQPMANQNDAEVIEKSHNVVGSRSANNLTVNHVTNVFNDSVISGDINIGNTIRDENQNE